MDEITEDELSERSDAFIKAIDELIWRPAEGGVAMAPTNQMTNLGITSLHTQANSSTVLIQAPHLLKQSNQIHELSYDTVVRLGKHLADIATRPEAAIPTTGDHLQYQAWTAAIALNAIDELPEYSLQDFYALFILRYFRSRSRIEAAERLMQF